MAAEQQEIEALAAEHKAELLKKINRTLRTLGTAVGELTELLAEFSGTPAKRMRETDKYGEPTWRYAIKRPIPPDFRMTRKFLEYGAEHQFGEESMRILMFGQGANYEGFVRYYQRTGAKWSDWTKVFEKWVRTERARKDKAQSTGGGVTRFDKLRTRS